MSVKSFKDKTSPAW